MPIRSPPPALSSSMKALAKPEYNTIHKIADAITIDTTRIDLIVLLLDISGACLAEFAIMLMIAKPASVSTTASDV